MFAIFRIKENTLAEIRNGKPLEVFTEWIICRKTLLTYVGNYFMFCKYRGYLQGFDLRIKKVSMDVICDRNSEILDLGSCSLHMEVPRLCFPLSMNPAAFAAISSM
jgi:hypothetical protein